MNILHVYRKKDGEDKDSTLGEFILLNAEGATLLTGFTLEPAGPDTVAANRDRRIPKGIYNVEFYNSKRFGDNTPCLFNEQVPKERKIAIHVGNKGTDTLGCILLGETTNWKDTILSSKKMIEKFKNIVKKDNLEVIIHNKINKES